ncbi:hypothetical protein C10C_0195 [Chlamydia serpentis]|uniref:Uncharacterized protein n=1 Tax=Chlamydia serpentis TaxID=1967782 RepID=A0A2R8FAD6_9CHLA|nr:hypothetical protein [Chlamydia serpentis]SPN73375.1 hypothetical protein C10C_0195 [Chlamydia serpentis]
MTINSIESKEVQMELLSLEKKTITDCSWHSKSIVTAICLIAVGLLFICIGVTLLSAAIPGFTGGTMLGCGIGSLVLGIILISVGLVCLLLKYKKASVPQAIPPPSTDEKVFVPTKYEPSPQPEPEEFLEKTHEPSNPISPLSTDEKVFVPTKYEPPPQWRPEEFLKKAHKSSKPIFLPKTQSEEISKLVIEQAGNQASLIKKRMMEAEEQAKAFKENEEEARKQSSRRILEESTKAVSSIKTQMNKNSTAMQKRKEKNQ